MKAKWFVFLSVLSLTLGLSLVGCELDEKSKIIYDNRTAHKATCYLDNSVVGDVEGHQKFKVEDLDEGSYELKAIASWDGNTMTWGPETIRLDAKTKFTWKMD